VVDGRDEVDGAPEAMPSHETDCPGSTLISRAVAVAFGDPLIRRNAAASSALEKMATSAGCEIAASLRSAKISPPAIMK
jgi:hypothetical protein